MNIMNFFTRKYDDIAYDKLLAEYTKVIRENEMLKNNDKYVDIIKFINDRDLNDDNDLLNILESAIRYSRLDVLLYIINKGYNIHGVSCDNEIALSIAIKHYNLKVIDFLIEHGASLNNALNIAITVGNIKLVEYLIEKYKVNIYSNIDELIECAIDNDHAKMHEYLINMKKNN